MSIREASELTRICGAFEGHEIPTGSILGKNDSRVAAGEADTRALALDTDAESGDSGDEPAQPTTRTLANMRSADNDFIRALSVSVWEPNALTARD